MTSGLILATLVAVAILAAVHAAWRQRDAALARRQLDEHNRRDPLTGLPNRLVLDDDPRRLPPPTGAVLAIDLVGSRDLNRVHGREVGDQVLVNMSKRLVRSVAFGDLVVRYAGDEFVLLCPTIGTVPEAEQLAKTLLTAIETPFESDGSPISLSSCIGVALRTADEPLIDVLRDAHAGLDRARSVGPGTYAIFDVTTDGRLTPVAAERRLRAALAAGEFRLYYQPVVSLWTRRLVGVEALLRWHDPDRGMQGPEKFMRTLERSDLMVPVGTWVVEEVCRQLRRWQEEFPDRPALTAKVNVTGRQLDHPEFADTVRAAIESTGANAGNLCLEVSERELSTESDHATTSLLEVEALGVKLALDDFGSDFSSLTHLRHLPIDRIQIDKSLVDGIGVSPQDETILEHLLALAKALGLVTVAKGVEREEQAERLRELGCDLAQGYYFSHPQPPSVIDSLLGDAGNKEEWQPPPPPPEDDVGVVVLPRFDATERQP